MFSIRALAGRRNVSIHVVVLNHNGRALLAECLPSVVRAAANSRYPCPVSVIDNESTDDSLPWLAENFPHVAIHHCANRGLCSFNDVLPTLTEQVVVLLNNDIRLADDAIDPLVEPLLAAPSSGESPCFFTAPRAWLFDGKTYEGFRAAVGWRWGLIESTARFDGAEALQHLPGESAAAGAALAVDREKFIALGGFDPLYLPGRIEDLDLAYRAFQTGFIGRYVPRSRAWHRGEATFASALGSAGSYRLALRNTLLFQWKNLRRPTNVIRHLLGIPVRLVADVVRASWQTSELRFGFTRALMAALPRLPAALQSKHRGESSIEREREFLTRYSAPRIKSSLLNVDITADEKRRWAVRHPLSRWYVQPIVRALTNFLAPSAVRPSHVTWLGVFLAAIAGVVLLTAPGSLWLVAILIWLTWLCDRLDGPLARMQHTATAHGARLDAVVDEAVDIGLHIAIGVVAAQQIQSAMPLFAAAVFVLGKIGLHRSHHALHDETHHTECDDCGRNHHAERDGYTGIHKLYHLPGNTDVRLHLLLAALVSGWLMPELIFVAAYYNLRWIVHSAKVALRPVVSGAEGAAS